MGAQFGAGDEGADFADRSAGEVVDPDADQFAAGVGDLVFVLADQGQGCTPPVEPAEVGDERVRQLEAEGAAEVASGEGGALTQVHHPFPFLDAANLVDNGPGSPGRLLRNVIEATEPARQTLAVLGRPTDQLLFYRTACPSRRGQEFAFGIAKNVEVGTESVSLRRLRRTVQVLIRKEPAQNAHQTHDTVYMLRDPASRDAAGETITQGLTDAAEHAHLLGAMRLVLGTDAETLVELSDDPELAAAIQRGDLDTATAACADFTHSPHNDPGLPCTASFLLCLACPNAVATRRHLPRLVHLHDGMTELHAVLDTTVWDRQWQQHFERISALLDTHTTAVERSDARARVTDADRTTIDRLLRRTFDA